MHLPLWWHPSGIKTLLHFKVKTEKKKERNKNNKNCLLPIIPLGAGCNCVYYNINYKLQQTDVWNIFLKFPCIWKLLWYGHVTFTSGRLKKLRCWVSYLDRMKWRQCWLQKVLAWAPVSRQTEYSDDSPRKEKKSNRSDSLKGILSNYILVLAEKMTHNRKSPTMSESWVSRYMASFDGLFDNSIQNIQNFEKYF